MIREGGKQCDMNPDSVSRLTAGHRACLRLVLEHKTSKQIAKDLGISHHTVDDRIKDAMRILGASSRVEAARLLAFADERSPQGLGPQPSHLASVAPLTAGFTGTMKGDETGDWPKVLREDRVEFDGLPRRDIGRPAWPVPAVGRRQNDLDFWQRIAWIGVIAIGAILSFVLLLAAFGLLSAGLQILSSLIR